MALNAERERTRQAQMESKKGKTWRPEENDKNMIRVFKFKHKATKEDVAEKLYAKEDIGKTFEEWVFPFQIQFGLVASNPKIPVRATPETLEMYESLKNSKDKGDQAQATLIRPAKKYAMNIMDMNAPEKGVQIFLAPGSVRKDIGKFVNDEEYGEAILGCKGRDWRIAFDKKKDPKEMYSTIIREKDKCRAVNSKIEDTVKDLFDPKVNREFADIKPVSELKVPEVEMGDGESNVTKMEDIGKDNGKAGGAKGNDSIFDD